MDTRKSWVVGTAAVLALGAGGAAVAASTGAAGSALVQRQVRGDDVASTTSSTEFTDLVGSNGSTVAVPVTVPSGSSRLITARFSAESQCSGDAGHWCSVRLVLRNTATGAVVEMNPKAGTDAAFDAAETGGDGFWGGHTVERFGRTGAGSYQVLVQRRVTAPSVTFRLDDWMLTVDVNS